VVAFLLVGEKLARGRVAPPDILHNHGIAPFHGVSEGCVFLECFLLVIGSAVNENRKRTAACWLNHVSTKNDSVAHRDRHILFDRQSAWILGCVLLRETTRAGEGI